MTVYDAQTTLIALEGEDAHDFLQAVLTQAIAAPDAKAAQYAALLTPQGKVISDLFVIGRGPQLYWLEAPRALAPALSARLSLMRLRRRVSLAALDEWRAFIAPPGAPAPDEGAAFSIVDPRRPDGGFALRWYAPAGRIAAQDARDFDAIRIAAGLPDLARDAAPEEVFALEALLEELNGVDFKKGCFPGQENVSRMKRRATTRKKFCRVRYGGAAPRFDAAIVAGAAELGVMRTGVQDVGIALVRLDRVGEAIAADIALTCEDRLLTVDAPDWLIWPTQAQES